MSRKKNTLVDFFIVGAQKSGTRALASFLKQSPHIGLSKTSRPEPRYFDTLNTERKNPDYSRYHAHFTDDSLARITGDSTPSYLFYPQAIPAIRRYNPEAKIICILRDPTERAYSQWNMQVEMGKESRSFIAALKNEAKYCRKNELHRNYSYVRRGLYYQQILHVFSCFPRDQCLILRNEELRQSHSKTMADVYRFLNLRQIELPVQEIVHSRRYPAPPVSAERALRRYFRKDIECLEKLLGWDCSAWK